MWKKILTFIAIAVGLTGVACGNNGGPFPPIPALANNPSEIYYQSYTVGGEGPVTVTVAFTARLERNFNGQLITYNLTDAQYFARFEARPFPLPAYYNSACVVSEDNDAECTFLMNRNHFREAICNGSDETYDYHLEADVSFTRTIGDETESGSNEYESPILHLYDVEPAAGIQNICTMEDDDPELDDPPAIDTDGDTVPDVLDTDDDNVDGADVDDDCPLIANLNVDADTDGLDDACDTDIAVIVLPPTDTDGDGDIDDVDIDDDDDGLDDTIDPCSLIVGACESDTDGDGVSNTADSCDGVADLGVDADEDGIDAACDDNDASGTLGRVPADCPPGTVRSFGAVATLCIDPDDADDNDDPPDCTGTACGPGTDTLGDVVAPVGGGGCSVAPGASGNTLNFLLAALGLIPLGVRRRSR